MTQDRNETRRRWSGGLLLSGAGAVALIAGFAGGYGREGDMATAWGVLAGIGFAMFFAGLAKAWIDRQGQRAAIAGGGSQRERLHSQRSQMLWIFPAVAIAFLFQSTLGSIEILEGRGAWKHAISVVLPVLYTWVVTMLVMGWDWQSRKNRRLMVDELTMTIRLRAMTAASVVLMIGLTVALGLGLWRANMGVLAIPFVLTIGAATAGIRFAWLDREAGRVEDEHG